MHKENTRKSGLSGQSRAEQELERGQRKSSLDNVL